MTVWSMHFEAPMEGSTARVDERLFLYHEREINTPPPVQSYHWINSFRCLAFSR